MVEKRGKWCSHQVALLNDLFGWVSVLALILQTPIAICYICLGPNSRYKKTIYAK